MSFAVLTASAARKLSKMSFEMLLGRLMAVVIALVRYFGRLV
jgi:hypothetical protein